jgi:hypothetical protein
VSRCDLTLHGSPVDLTVALQIGGGILAVRLALYSSHKIEFVFITLEWIEKGPALSRFYV